MAFPEIIGDVRYLRFGNDANSRASILRTGNRILQLRAARTIPAIQARAGSVTRAVPSVAGSSPGLEFIFGTFGVRTVARLLDVTFARRFTAHYPGNGRSGPAEAPVAGLLPVADQSVVAILVDRACARDVAIPLIVHELVLPFHVCCGELFTLHISILCIGLPSTTPAA
jgi:hypothetical protein